MDANILSHLVFLYGAETGRQTAERVEEMLRRYASLLLPQRPPLTARDAVLITYGDQFQAEGEAPLRTLQRFQEQFLRGLVPGVHILPFWPYSSDDGFSVIDYRTVDPRLGSWDDVRLVGQNGRLMVDLVLNHCSRQSAWFQGYLRGQPPYNHYFIETDPSLDLSQVGRPRALPLLSAVETAGGTRHVWTTFSADQVDLNYANPQVLLEMIDILLGYIAQGAAIIRLDAIAYLWKEIGTTCLHLPQTHRCVQLLRAVAERAAPGTLILTETNVPHRDNLSYFGDGGNEAHMVYNFALPVLCLHALQTGDGRLLSAWAAGLSLPSRQVTVFNFLASHDGVGVNPARGILSEAEIEALVRRCESAGGLTSLKDNPDGSQSVYELNVNYLDALSLPGQPGGLEVGERRFLAAQAIMLAFLGVPGIYVHSLLGSRGWPEGAQASGRKRTINRQKFNAPALMAELRDPASRRGRIYAQLSAFLRARQACPAFDPYGDQRVIAAHPAALVLLRQHSGTQALCSFNLSGDTIDCDLDGLPSEWSDLLDGGAKVYLNDGLRLRPYQISWLERRETNGD